MVDSSGTWFDSPSGGFKVEAVADGFRPYPHQQAAWDAMSRHFLDESKKAGIVVVPTGGGKTKLAERWLLSNHVRNGGRVLWLAHRRSLLVQAYRDFAADAHLAVGLDSLRLARVSGDDLRWAGISADDHVVFAMIQSTATAGSLGFLDLLCDQSPRGLFVVIDEAHHAAAPSYLRVLGRLRERGIPLLGLTATPVRMGEDDNKRLWKLFDRQLIYEVRKRDLIERGILATPIPETVRTRVELERDFTPSDVEHLEKYGELAQEVLERLAQHASRNKLIVDHYVRNAARFGKTIVFAATAAHAQTLASEFNRANVAADYVDYTRRDSSEVMAKFRDQTEPMVIANVEMLTEGFDAPRTQTVFIARPTRSEALLSQMVGRALRGRAANGTEVAHLVTFVDTWNTYNPLDTEVVIAAGEPDVLEESRGVRGPLVVVSAELIAEAYRLVNSAYRGFFEGVYACLPDSWYVWEEETDYDVNRRLVLVFDNQREGFERMHAELIVNQNLPAEVTRDFAAQVRRDYFQGCCDPLPTIHDLLALLSAFASGQSVARYSFDEKNKFDPVRLAQELRKFAPDEQANKLREIFNNDAVCRLVYRNDFRAFSEDFHQALQRLVFGGLVPDKVQPVVVAPALTTIRSWPQGSAGYRLGDIWDSVMGQPRNFPKGAPLVSDRKYSDRPLAGMWGFYRYSDRTIVISSVLNSPDVPRFVVEFLMYHEALHADMPTSGHNSEFRQRERRFTPSASAIQDALERGYQPVTGEETWRALADQFLDTFHRRFTLADVGAAEMQY